MSKDICLPDSQTHVIVENGKLRLWDTMIMTKQSLNKSTFGLTYDDKKKEEE